MSLLTGSRKFSTINARSLSRGCDRMGHIRFFTKVVDLRGPGSTLIATMSDEAIKLAPPFEVVLSENVKGRYGYKDAHVDIELRLPAPISTVKETYTRAFEDEYVRTLEKALENAALLEEMPKEERSRVETPISVDLGGPVTGKYGFPDGHVELIVELPLVFRLVCSSYTAVFEPDEVVALREALKKAILWADLDEAERERIGA